MAACVLGYAARETAVPEPGRRDLHRYVECANHAGVQVRYLRPHDQEQVDGHGRALRRQRLALAVQDTDGGIVWLRETEHGSGVLPLPSVMRLGRQARLTVRIGLMTTSKITSRITGEVGLRFNSRVDMRLTCRISSPIIAHRRTIEDRNHSRYGCSIQRESRHRKRPENGLGGGILNRPGNRPGNGSHCGSRNVDSGRPECA